MESGKFSFKTPVMLLIFGLVIAAGINAQANSSLNGRWAAVEDGVEVIYDFRNGNYEILINEESFGMISLLKGTYTASDSEIVFNIDSIFGGFFKLLFEEIGIQTKIDEKWYSIEDFLVFFISVFKDFGLSESDIDEIVNETIGELSTTIPYSLNGNTLIMKSPFTTDVNAETVFTRR